MNDYATKLALFTLLLICVTIHSFQVTKDDRKALRDTLLRWDYIYGLDPTYTFPDDMFLFNMIDEFETIHRQIFKVTNDKELKKYVHTTKLSYKKVRHYLKFIFKKRIDIIMGKVAKAAQKAKTKNEIHDLQKLQAVIASARQGERLDEQANVIKTWVNRNRPSE